MISIIVKVTSSDLCVVYWNYGSDLALLVTVLALVDWKEFGDDRTKGLHVREVRLLAIEHLVATLVLNVGR